MRMCSGVSIEVAKAHDSCMPAERTLVAVTDSDDRPVLDQINPMPTEPKNNFPPVVANFGGTTVLQGGASYWISLSSDTSVPNSWIAWNYNSTGDVGTRAHRTDGGPWQVFSGTDPRGAFRINGTPVPEPAAALALAPASLTLLRPHRRHRQRDA